MIAQMLSLPAIPAAPFTLSAPRFPRRAAAPMTERRSIVAAKPLRQGLPRHTAPAREGLLSR